MIIAIQKLRNQAKPKWNNWEKTLSLPQIAKFTRNNNLRTVELQILANKQNGGQTADLSSQKNCGQNTANSQSWHGSSTRNIFVRYFSISDICHFTIWKIWREKCRDAALKRGRDFPSSQINNSCMHEICPKYYVISSPNEWSFFRLSAYRYLWGPCRTSRSVILYHAWGTYNNFK